MSWVAILPWGYTPLELDKGMLLWPHFARSCVQILPWGEVIPIVLLVIYPEAKVLVESLVHVL